MKKQQFKYFAFISYNSKDMEWGKKIQRKLEHYRMPATLCSEHGWDRTPIRPVFFAPTDIQPGGLTEELQERLRASQNLIVICSPNSAKSEWVGKEIEFFHQLGRTQQIHLFIVDGVPHSGNPDTECFNKVVDDLGLPEILGANIHEQTQTFPFTKISWSWMNKQRAYVQLISKLLGVEFDAIWQRHRRLLFQKMVAWIVGIIAILGIILGVWLSNQPVDMEVKLKEASIHNPNLPTLRNAVITMTLDNETKTDTVHSLDRGITFTNIPHRYLNKEVCIQVECATCLPVDTVVLLSKNVTVNLRRTPDYYGHVRFCLWNPTTEQALSNTEVIVAGHPTTSDGNGIVELSIPLSEQSTAYRVTSSSVRLADEMISMPCGSDDIIIVK